MPRVKATKEASVCIFSLSDHFQLQFRLFYANSDLLSLQIDLVSIALGGGKNAFQAKMANL